MLGLVACAIWAIGPNNTQTRKCMPIMIVAMSKCGNFIASGSHVKYWVYGKISNRVSSGYPIRNKFYNEF